MLEKISKALWVQNNEGNYPPRIHNLNKILAQAKVELKEEDNVFLADVNKFQIQGRYPDYISDIYKICTKDLTTKYLETIKILRICLLKKLQ